MKGDARTHDRNRVASSDGQDISARDNAGASLLHGGFDVVNNVESSG